MRKLLVFILLALFSAPMFGQNRTVSGRVTDDKGEVVPGASVKVRGTNTGVAADNNGQFRISVKTGDVLEVTGVDIDPVQITVRDGNVVNVSVKRNVTMVSEVVITALGIRRKAEEIGYSTATVKSDQITAGRSFNLAQALSGKVSGLNISNTSNSVNATPRIILRGLRSLTGDNTALIVLDGVPVPSNTINYINPNDVERVDVLKGGQAATLFGSEGVNGAIVITTKKGNAKPEISVTHSSNIEMVSYLPKFQKSFGSGSAYGSSRAENFHVAENQQYGDEFDGSIRPLGRALADGSIMLIPYSYIDGVREKMWDKGYTGQTDVSYRGGDQTSNFFLSYQHLNSNGIVPGDKYERNSFRMNASRTYGKVNLSFDATYTWDKADRTTTDYYFFALNSAGWVPMDQLRDWRNNKFADPSGYFNDYYNNPWWQLDNNRSLGKNNFFNGNIKFTYKPIESLEFNARVALANTNSVGTNSFNNYTYTGWARSNAYVDYFDNNYDRFLTGIGRSVARTPIAGRLEDGYSNGNRINIDVLATYTKNIKDISLKAIAGSTVQIRTGKNIDAAMTGLSAPDLFNFSNTATGLFTAGNSITQQRKIGGYGDVTIGYKGWIYLHGVVRRDYTSVFSGPSIGFNNPAYTFYGGDVSFMVTDLIPSLKGKVVDAIKLRGGYNRNANDNLAPYRLQATFPNSPGFPFTGLIGTGVSATTVSPDLEPEVVKTAEVGLEISLFKNRINFEAAAYKQKSEKQILDVNISGATGFTGYLLNAADLDNQGVELDLRANVLKSKDWSINVNANYAYTTNKVNTLYGNTGLNSLVYTQDGLVSLSAELGQMFPYLKTTVYQRDDMGRVVIDTADGWAIRENAMSGHGTTTPKHILGVGINVTFKNFTFVANAEYRGGHVVYHDIGTDMSFTGTSALTSMYHRDQFVWPNSSYYDGSKYVQNTNFAVDNYKAIYQGYGDLGFSRGFNGTGEFFVSSGAFWKLRDVSLSYNFPTKLLGNQKAIKGMAITAWARNVLVLLPPDNWFTDPEFSNTNNNGQGINTTGNTPPTRQIGATLKLVF